MTTIEVPREPLQRALNMICLQTGTPKERFKLSDRLYVLGVTWSTDGIFDVTFKLDYQDEQTITIKQIPLLEKDFHIKLVEQDNVIMDFPSGPNANPGITASHITITLAA